MADGGGVNRLPSSNRGVSRSGTEALRVAMASELRTWAGIDWLAGSVDLLELLDEAGWWQGRAAEDADADGLCAHLKAYGPKRKRETRADEHGELVQGERAPFVEPDDVVLSIAAAAFRYFFEGTGLVLSAKANPGSFYAYRFPLFNVWGDVAGMLELGGELTLRKGGRPSLRFELTGLGCGLYELRGDPCADHAERWLALRAQLARVDAQLTRIDLAFDDFDGKRNLALAECMYQVGEFDYSFAGERKRPQAKGFHDYGSGKGSTFYVGNSSSEKQLRVYEKGKQLGDPESPWVRWELQLRSSSRKRVALDVLADPMSYMRGAFECLDFVSSCMARLAVTKEVTKATAKSVMRHVKRQYGATLREVWRLAPSAEDLRLLIEALSVDKVPRWAKKGRLTWADVPGLIPARDDDEEQGNGRE